MKGRALWTAYADGTMSANEAKAKRVSRKLEHAEQRAVIQWCAMTENIPELKLIFAIPNAGGYSGGFTNNVNRVKGMIAEGVKAGVPDLFLPIARNGYHGMFIEMKSQHGRVSPEQHEWLKALKAQGYYTVIAFGCTEAIERITQYVLGQINSEPLRDGR